MRAGAFSLLLVFIASAVAQNRTSSDVAQSGHDGQKEREVCVESLSTYAVDPTTAKPDIPDDLNNVTLLYNVSGCYGTCPSFSMSIQENQVKWEGRAFVKAKGGRKSEIQPQYFRELVGLWIDGNVYAMRDDYCSTVCPDGITSVVMDAQESSITLKTPSFTKSVLECYFTVDGRAATPKPPDAYLRLSQKLVEFAKSKNWL